MPVGVAIVGPGRVGTALGVLWAAGGCEVTGFVGRRPETAAAAVARCGQGRVLGLAELAQATCVVVAVDDASLPACVAQAAAVGAVRTCALWLHTSGAADESVLAPVAALGARTGTFHPACPVPDADAGVDALPGKPVVLSGSPRARRLLGVLAARAGMIPVWRSPGADPARYHAACALAANAGTALFGLVTDLLAEGLQPADARALAAALMHAAVDASAVRGAAAALSGPIVRADATTVARHLAALQGDSETGEVYRAVMVAVARLAGRGGHLSQAQVEAFVRLLKG